MVIGREADVCDWWIAPRGNKWLPDAQWVYNVSTVNISARELSCLKPSSRRGGHIITAI